MYFIFLIVCVFVAYVTTDNQYDDFKDFRWNDDERINNLKKQISNVAFLQRILEQDYDSTEHFPFEHEYPSLTVPYQYSEEFNDNYVSYDEELNEVTSMIYSELEDLVNIKNEQIKVLERELLNHLSALNELNEEYKKAFGDSPKFDKIIGEVLSDLEYILKKIFNTPESEDLPKDRIYLNAELLEVLEKFCTSYKNYILDFKNAKNFNGKVTLEVDDFLTNLDQYISITNKTGLYADFLELKNDINKFNEDENIYFIINNLPKCSKTKSEEITVQEKKLLNGLSAFNELYNDYKKAFGDSPKFDKKISGMLLDLENILKKMFIIPKSKDLPKDILILNNEFKEVLEKLRTCYKNYVLDFKNDKSFNGKVALGVDDFFNNLDQYFSITNKIGVYADVLEIKNDVKKFNKDENVYFRIKNIPKYLKDERPHLIDSLKLRINDEVINISNLYDTPNKINAGFNSVEIISSNENSKAIN